jgi:exopolysaccharide production protein ExoZ
MNMVIKDIKNKNIYALQIYRGLAAFSVVLFHAEGIILNWSGEGYFTWGFYGVNLFFVLSGFIICLIHYDDIGKPQKATSYLNKRFSRIYPVYWIVFIVSYFVFFREKNIPIYHLIDSIFILKISRFDKIVPVAWTLSYEILFYAVFFVLIMSRKVGLMILFAWISLILYRLIIDVNLMPPYT